MSGKLFIHFFLIFFVSFVWAQENNQELGTTQVNVNSPGATQSTKASQQAVGAPNGSVSTNNADVGATQVNVATPGATQITTVNQQAGGAAPVNSIDIASLEDSSPDSFQSTSITDDDSNTLVQSTPGNVQIKSGLGNQISNIGTSTASDVSSSSSRQNLLRRSSSFTIITQTVPGTNQQRILYRFGLNGPFYEITAPQPSTNGAVTATTATVQTAATPASPASGAQKSCFPFDFGCFFKNSLAKHFQRKTEARA